MSRLLIPIQPTAGSAAATALAAALLSLTLPSAGARGQGAPAAEEGRLRIEFQGAPVGREHYRLTRTSQEVMVESEVVLEVGQERLRQTTRLRLSPDYRPQHYEWKMEEPQKKWLRMEFEGSRAVVRFPREDGKEEEQAFTFDPARVFLLDINVFHHFLLLARSQEFREGEPKKVQVFVPQSVQPGVVEVEVGGWETLEEAGGPVRARRFRITSEDNQVTLWLGENDRFLRLEVPSAEVRVRPEPPTS